MLDSLSNRTKNKLKIGSIILLFLGIAFAISVITTHMTEKKKAEQALEPKSKKKMSLLTDKVEKDLWVAAESQNIKALESSLQQLQGRYDVLNREIEEIKKSQNVQKDVAKDKPIFPVPSSQLPKGQPPLPSSVDKTEQQQVATPQPSPTPTPLPEKPERNINIFEDASKKSDKLSSGEKIVDKVASASFKKHTDRVWLPSGSFMKARLINGIDAPTSGGAQAEPYPVLMVVKDLSILPNNFRLSLVECFVIGAGYGNISDERAYIKTERLSCVRKDGQSIDVPLKGHVVGEDGKLGMRGKVVSKQGQQIAMAIFSGTLSGLGNALKPQQSLSLNLNPTASSGVTQTPSMADIFLGTATGGVGNALNKVAEHYLKMAERMFPIIEIDAGRDVEIFILVGQELTIKTVSSKERGDVQQKTRTPQVRKTDNIPTPVGKESIPNK